MDTSRGHAGRTIVQRNETALAQNTRVTIAAASDLPPESRLVAGTAYDFGPAGIAFAVPVLGTIEYGTLAVGQAEDAP